MTERPKPRRADLLSGVTVDTAQLPPAVFGETLLSSEELARFLGVSERHLSKLRTEGTGPKFCNIGPRRIAYQFHDVCDWIQSNKRSSTSVATSWDLAIQAARRGALP